MTSLEQTAYPRFTRAPSLKELPVYLVQYAQGREATRFEHLAELQQVYSFCSFSPHLYKEMAAWFLLLALTTENGVDLIEAECTVLGGYAKTSILLTAF